MKFPLYQKGDGKMFDFHAFKITDNQTNFHLTSK